MFSDALKKKTAEKAQNEPAATEGAASTPEPSAAGKATTSGEVAEANEESTATGSADPGTSQQPSTSGQSSKLTPPASSATSLKRKRKQASSLSRDDISGFMNDLKTSNETAMQSFLEAEKESLKQLSENEEKRLKREHEHDLKMMQMFCAKQKHSYN